MAGGRVSGSVSTPTVDVAIDTGNPFLNLTLHAFLKIGTVAAAEDTFHIIQNVAQFPFPEVHKYGKPKTEECEQKRISKTVTSGCAANIQLGSISNSDFEKTLKKMCKEGAYWGTVSGVYVGMEYGVARIRGHRDWKNAMIGGAITGALVSAASNNKKDSIAIDAITRAAVATAAEFINYLT